MSARSPFRRTPNEAETRMTWMGGIGTWFLRGVVGIRNVAKNMPV